ncbi:hypothetical protein IV102_13170 [bacterium]|nr:hypothetical protein [bacterium]
MLNLVNANANLRNTSPLTPAKGPAQGKPGQPTDKVELAQQSDSSSTMPKWAAAAFSALGLVAGAAGAAQAQQAHVVVAQNPQQVADLMQQLDEASLKQGIELEFMVPSPIGGGRRIAKEDAAELLGEGRRVLLAEVTSSGGPVRGGEPTLVRRETYLTGQSDLESYTRYFTNSEPQNDMERAAQKLKKFVYGQTELTLLQRPGQNPERPSLSPFSAARRLEREQPVTVRTEPDGIVRTEAKETQLTGLADVDSLLPSCQIVQDFQMQPDGTIQLVEQSYCEGGR